MKPYTKDEHARHLLKLLENHDPCDKCVATFCHQMRYYLFNYYRNGSRIWGMPQHDICKICIEFVGCSVKIMEAVESWCPCHALGQDEAIKRSWIALEEEGYLDMEDKCDRCNEKITVGYSWFNGQNICQKCLDSEDNLLIQLANSGQDIWDYEGCGYLPKEDGSNWIEKDKP